MKNCPRCLFVDDDHIADEWGEPDAARWCVGVGRIIVSICQPDATPYPGFDASAVITGDQLDVPVTFPEVWEIPSPWGGPQTHGTKAETGPERLGSLQFDELPQHWQLKPGLPARIKITARNAKLYSYWFD